MPNLRTPDDRFANLPAFAYAPHYLEDLPGSGGARVHYVDEGPRDADVVWLCLHGQPTWSYLYRKMIPVFVKAGHRVVAPDLIGFGRSDKPSEDATYTFDFHRQMLLAFIAKLDLKGVRLVVQDWGGLLGLTLPMEAPERYAGALIMNTAIATGDIPLGQGFVMWREFNRSKPDLKVGKLLQQATPILSPEEAAAYDAPFPDVTYKAGVRRFPDLVPDKEDSPGAAVSRKARAWWRNEWQGKSLMAIGMQDPVLGPPAMQYLHSLIRNCPVPMEIQDAGHFVQEWGEEIAERALAALG